MKQRVEVAEKLFKEGYNCSQSIFAAYSDLYGIDKETALKLSASFGGGMGRLREVCGAVSGMFMIAGLATGSTQKMDEVGKKHNYDLVQRLAEEFKCLSGSIICRDLLGLDGKDDTAFQDTQPEKRTQEYYDTRPCEQLIRYAAELIEKNIISVTFEPVISEVHRKEVAELAHKIWYEHYSSIISREQIDYMLEKFQSEKAMEEQIRQQGYRFTA